MDDLCQNTIHSQKHQIHLSNKIINQVSLEEFVARNSVFWYKFIGQLFWLENRDS